MTKAVQKITLSPSRDIPFNKLVLSQSNVRRVKAGVSIEQLAESIAQRTLLQSLNVRAVADAEGSETGMFEVPAGGRRYRALELLVKQKRMAKTQSVPCVVREGGIAEDDSLAENDERVGLHSLDQFRAFQTLRDAGLSEEDIAARHFVTPAIVKQRLRLASVSPKLHEVYAEDGMTLEQLMAFSVTAGNLCSRPVYRDGQPVESREAVARRDRLIEKLASMSPVPGALDQIVQRFGTDLVAEVTGRSRRIIRKGARLLVETRAGSANLAETSAFMDDVKRILVFSDAGGTGRSYHAELSARNRRLRLHYLLEPGWKADAAIQGLGRTNRTNQAQPPLFRPIATNVKAEKRFLSTIARRLDTLGAITRGQRQTGGQGLFRPEDNLESQYGRDALRQLYKLLARGKVEGCSLERFEDATGLKLADANGIKDELPPITTFLNRLLALTIELQNILFTAFEQLLTARIEGAIASGTYDVGLETLRAESFVVTDRRTIYVHPVTCAETGLLTITQRERNHPESLDDVLGRLSDHRAVLLLNERSGRAAMQIPAPSFMLDDGEIEQRVRLIRPLEQHSVPSQMMTESHWVEADRERFSAAWLAELAEVPEFTESTIHVVAGLLLPIWKRLPNESTRVYRLQTDAGERIIGRKVSTAWVASFLAAESPALTPDAAFAALLEGQTVLKLAEGLQLRRVRVMGAYRIELSGFDDTMRDRLRAYGLFGEIISWKFRMFVPSDASGVEILSRVIDRYAIERISDREVA
jgi:ParB/RepB/Spo0J family partition protein